MKYNRNSSTGSWILASTVTAVEEMSPIEISSRAHQKSLARPAGGQEAKADITHRLRGCSVEILYE
jgi:hypothetical protein